MKHRSTGTPTLSRKLPSITAGHALAKRSHRFIGGPRLGLTIRHLALFAFSALELLGYTLLRLWNHGLIHVLFLKLFVGLAALVRFHIFVRHGGEALGADFAGKDALPKGGIGLVFEVLEEGTHFLAVFFVVCFASISIGGSLDGSGDWHDLFWY
jgi:hypothetical protein